MKKYDGSSALTTVLDGLSSPVIAGVETQDTILIRGTRGLKAIWSLPQIQDPSMKWVSTHWGML